MSHTLDPVRSTEPVSHDPAAGFTIVGAGSPSELQSFARLALQYSKWLGVDLCFQVCLLVLVEVLCAHVASGTCYRQVVYRDDT
jgi:hypothetical protein